MTAMIPAWVGGALQPVEKLEVHRRGLRHKAISVFVTSGEFVLLQQRAMCKYHTPGLWANTCCTHPHWDEASAVAAERRLYEELGIAGLDLVHRDRVEYRAAVGDDMIEHEVVDIFVAEMDRSQHFAPNPDEVMKTSWVHSGDLARLIDRAPETYTPWFKIYVARHAEQIFGIAFANAARRSKEPVS
ncbi:MAG: isopentenyl-diphosphate delta-isomerase [Rhodobacteraceae bacterium]|nr:isopentenyl-diphosphate delta-isomerase [Paracoccaceae bacterium]